MSPSKSVLVTGASTGGLGSSLVSAFHRRGYRVFATVRTLSKAKDIEKLANVEVLTMDVTSPESVKETASIVQQRLGSEGLDILVNNAGTGHGSPLLDVDIEEAKRLFDANLWGALATTQAFAALVIKARGTIVNISSCGAKVHTPWIGIYSASKAALSQLSETLRLELKPFNVKVVTAFVGTVQTNFYNNERKHPLPDGSLYKAIEDRILRSIAGDDNPEGEPVDKFSEALVRDIIGNGNGPVWRGSYSTLTRLSALFMPLRLFDYLLCKRRGIYELEYSSSKQK